MRYSKTPDPTPLALEKLPCWMRASAAATLAAASLFRRSDQAANGLRPPRSRYSRTSTIADGNTYGTIVKDCLGGLCFGLLMRGLALDEVGSLLRMRSGENKQPRIGLEPCNPRLEIGG